MDWILPAVGIALGIVVLWLREAGLPRLALHRLERGRPVAVRGRLRVDDRSEAALIRRNGPDLVVTTGRRTWLVPASQAALARGRTGGDDREETWTVRLRSARGEAAHLDVPSRWREVVRRLGQDAPAAAAGTFRTGLPYPRWALAVAITSAAALAGWLWILLRTTQRTSAVLRIADEETSCWVEWSEAGATFRGAPTCPDPLPSVGEPMTYLTTPWPVAGNAWDTDLPWLLAVLLGTVLVAAGVRLLGFALRARGRSAPERAVLVDHGAEALGDGAPAVLAGSAERPHLVWTQVLDRAERDLGWADLPLGEPPRAGWWADVVTAARSAPRWPLFVAVVAGVFALPVEDGVDTWTIAAAVVAALALLWSLAGFVRVLTLLRRPWNAPESSSWAFRAAQNGFSEWWFVLLDGDRPRWLVPVPARPPLRGSCRVRGELSDGAAVHVLVDGVLWTPSGGAVEALDPVLEDVREDLEYQRTGEVPEAPVR